MELPCSSFHPKNGLEVGLPLIHPEFCKGLKFMKLDVEHAKS